MAIKVCDAIMGSGKSSAAINWMNEHPDQKFIYITPYLEEADRIRKACPALQFKEPSAKLPEYGFKKYKHTLGLLADGENITSTHNLFLRYTDEVIDLIKKHQYTLIIDEAVEILRESRIKTSDVTLIDRAGWVSKQDDIIKINPTFEYTDGRMNEVVALAKGNRLINIDDKNGSAYYYWVFSKEVLLSFRYVYVLTYMFEAQMMKYCLDLYDIPYDKIGIKRDKDGYHFWGSMEYIPPYTKTLSQKIHIFENAKLNAIGNNKHALSFTWFQHLTGKSPKGKSLQKNVYNYFNNYMRDKAAPKRLWATYEEGKHFIRDKGYYRRDSAFNLRATNDYRDKQVLAYCVNIFMQPHKKNYLQSHGVTVLEDEYATSIMIQWIWRSAIRDGEEIWIYIPSRRMRQLLKDWIKQTEKNYIEYERRTENE